MNKKSKTNNKTILLTSFIVFILSFVYISSVSSIANANDTTIKHKLTNCYIDIQDNTGKNIAGLSFGNDDKPCVDSHNNKLIINKNSHFGKTQNTIIDSNGGFWEGDCGNWGSCTAFLYQFETDQVAGVGAGAGIADLLAVLDGLGIPGKIVAAVVGFGVAYYVAIASKHNCMAIKDYGVAYGWEVHHQWHCH